MKTPWLLAATAELATAEPIPKSAVRWNEYAFSLCCSDSTLWLKVKRSKTAVLAVRLAYAPDGSLAVERARDGVYEVAASYGRARVHLTNGDVVRAQVFLTPFEDLCLTNWPRDLVFHAESGTVHAAQRSAARLAIGHSSTN